ncbi:MAG TPA: class I SAM-dependent methyltransferase [Blastocatellia bacterium]|nr:class I SAM-dependent methyltransferase [Blastocatellia bacterium]
MESEEYHLAELSVAADGTDSRRIMPPILDSYSRILDVGCGAGQTLIASNTGPGVFAAGVDVNLSALALGKKLDGRFGFVCAKGEALPFQTGSFDFVFSRVSLPYMHLNNALSEMCRVLRVGGSLWIVLHPFSMAAGRFLENLSQLKIKGAIYSLYVLANGLSIHSVGKQIPLRSRSGINESFQTNRGISRELRRAGFDNIVIERGRFFVVTASKAARR